MVDQLGIMFSIQHTCSSERLHQLFVWWIIVAQHKSIVSSFNVVDNTRDESLFYLPVHAVHRTYMLTSLKDINTITQRAL